MHCTGTSFKAQSSIAIAEIEYYIPNGVTVSDSYNTLFVDNKRYFASTLDVTSVLVPFVHAL